jgi:hypothetical protein
MYPLGVGKYASMVSGTATNTNNRNFPTLGRVILLITVLCTLFSGLSFFLDCYRIPFLTIVLLVVFYTGTWIESDHHFDVLPRDESPPPIFSADVLRNAPEKINSFTWYAPKDLVIRLSGDPGKLMPAIRRIIASADPEQPISDVQTLSAIVRAETTPRLVQLRVLGTFAAIAFVLAAIGIHGLLAFAVSNRAQEIGVRVAMGAQPGDILGMVMREGFMLAAIVYPLRRVGCLCSTARHADPIGWSETGRSSDVLGCSRAGAVDDDHWKLPTCHASGARRSDDRYPRRLAEFHLRALRFPGDIVGSRRGA